MLLSILVSGLLAGGCSSPRPALSVGQVPEDFALELRLHPTEQHEGAVYIVEPNRTLRAAAGGNLSGPYYPPQTRTLTSTQMLRVYNLLAESGVLESEAQAEESAAPLDLYVSAGGRRRGVPVGPDERADLEPLVSELDRLAWVRPRGR